MQLKGRKLTLKMQGNDVASLHRSLEKLGYKIYGTERDTNTFAEATVQAVKDFQKKHGYQVNGVVDEKLAEKIDELLCKVKYPLRLNMKGEEIKFLHKTLLLADLKIDKRELENQQFGKTTLKAVKQFQQLNWLSETGEVDKATAVKLNELTPAKKSKIEGPKYRIRGSVRNEDWEGIPGVTVQLFERTLRDRIQIGERKTFKNGFYDLWYMPPKDGNTIKRSFQLIVKFIFPDGTEIEENVDTPKLVVWVNYTKGEDSYQGVSEYEIIYKKVTKELRDTQLSLEEIEESEENQDISFLSARTGILALEIYKLALSYRLERLAQKYLSSDKFKREKCVTLNSEIFYAFLRQNLSSNMPEDLLDLKNWSNVESIVHDCLDGIVTLESGIQEATLEKALQNNLISRKYRNLVSQITNELQLLAKVILLQQPLFNNSTMADLLDLSKMNQTEYMAFSQLYAENKGINEQFWKTARKIFDPVTIADVESTFVIGEITQYYEPLVKRIKTSIQKSGLRSRVRRPRDIAKYSEKEWARLIRWGGNQVPENIEGSNVQDKVQNYAISLRAKAEQSFPTTAFVASAKKSFMYGRQIESILNLYDEKPEFDLKREHINHLMSLDQIKNSVSNVKDQEIMVSEFKAMQRIFRLAPNVKTANVLVKKRIHNSGQVYLQGKKRFIEKMIAENVTENDAKLVYEAAATNYALLVTQIFQLRTNFTRFTPRAVTSWSLADPQTDFRDFPGLDTLFGSLDYCECDPARSMYSPAAYLVDILHFLSEKGDIAGRKTAKNLLFERRPDIGNIELTDENTNLLLPYVDLVNEILEQAVAPFPVFQPFEISGMFALDLDQQKISDTLKQAFKPELSDDAVIIVKQLGKWWIISEPSYSYIIKRVEDGSSLGILKVVSRSCQTFGDARELAVAPQYLNDLAYQKLQKAVYPWTLPFDFWHEEANAYLQHLEVPRYRLKEVFAPINSYGNHLNDVQIACDYLDISTMERKIITGFDPERSIDFKSLWNFWGINRTVRITTFEGISKIVMWYDALTHVNILLEQIGFELTDKQKGFGYRKLLELLDTKYLNPFQNGKRRFIIRSLDGNSTTCQLDKLVISVQDYAYEDQWLIELFDKMHRFVRLAQAIGWTYQDLDRAITALAVNQGDLDDDFLIKLYYVQRIHKERNAPITVILSWWADLDTYRYTDYMKQGQPKNPTLFDQVFWDTKVFGAYSDELDSTVKTVLISEYMPTVASALGINQNDLTLLMEKLSVNTLMDVSTLSILYRYVSLAKVLRLSINDLLTVSDLTKVKPFDRSRTEETILFIEQVEKIQKAGFTITELAYLFQHNISEAIRTISDANIASILKELQRGLRKINDENTLTDQTLDSLGEMVKKKLALLHWDKSSIEQLISMLNDTIIYEVQPATLSAEVISSIATTEHLSYDTEAEILKFTGVMTEETKTHLLGLCEDVNYQTSIADLYDMPRNSFYELMQVFGAYNLSEDEYFSLIFAVEPKLTPEQRYIKLLQDRILPYLRKSLSEDYVVSVLSEALLLDREIIEPLLNTWVYSANAETRSMDDLLALEFITSNPDEVLNLQQFPAQNSTVLTLQKIALILRKLNIKIEQLRWIFEYGPSVGWINLNTLPVEENLVQIPELFAKMVKLIDFCNMRDQLSITDEFFTELYEESNCANDFLKTLSARTEWSLTDLEYIVAKSLKAKYPDDYRDESILLRLSTCTEVLKKLGTSADQCISWIESELLDSSITNEIKQVVKAKYGEQWFNLASTVRDPLREKQRNALLAYLLHHQPVGVKWENMSDLYAHFLIDVEMSPCQKTSRIKQAIASVQLFVQRCLMNLETEVMIDNERDEWDQWKWMKNYRVWEANRKVFLYPENWIEPELRDDKSAFFIELENAILQNEITHENAENAFRNYLEKLSDVSKLEVCGVYHEKATDIDILHVFARSKGSPALYFYRKYINRSYWTSWEKIELDIVGDHLIPVIYNRKLYLFWPIFTEKVPKRKTLIPPAQPSDSSEYAPEPQKYWEVQLAWSVHTNGNWSSKKISKRKLIHPWPRPQFSYHFRPRLVGYKLWIDVFISTSREFNNETFYDPINNTWAPLTHIRYDETARPWHSSSFIFNGDVIDIKMKDLLGSYYNNVHINFGDDGRAITILYDFEPRLLLPPGMHCQSTALVNNQEHLNSNNLSIIIPYRNGLTNNCLLRSANNPFELVASHQDKRVFNFKYRPFFYQDQERAFVIEHKYMNGASHFNFKPFYHPFTDVFTQELNRYGLDSLFTREMQIEPEQILKKSMGIKEFDFGSEYAPEERIVNYEDVQKEIVDFSFDGAYSVYNWEMFFHAPMMIACRLSQNQRFEEAMHWFHYIFNPTKADIDEIPKRYWITRPFYQHGSVEYQNQRIENLLKLINSENPEFEKQVETWRANAFNPHMLARLRPVAYQWAVVMKYIDNLIAWGDQLFSLDTMESINEATLLYILAAEILGPRPQSIPPRERVSLMSYNELEEYQLDMMGNVDIDAGWENDLLYYFAGNNGVTLQASEPLPHVMFYFSIPHNEKLIKYWDKVEDRLFKIRHCMNLKGIVRQLPLFEPPIDPALLVQATAAGVSAGELMSALNTPLPYYRFRVTIEKSKLFCNELKALGSTLLSSLEKKDAENLALIRSKHEVELLESIKAVKQQQIKELDSMIEGLEKSKAVIEERRDYYANIPKTNANEELQLAKLKSAFKKQEAAQSIQLGASLLALLPDIDLGASGFGGSPVAKFKLGGLNLAQWAKASSDVLSYLSMMDSNEATRASVQGGYDRRWEEWQFQLRLVEKELQQMDKQIEAAIIRKQIAEKELDNHELQIANAQSVDEFMQNKYTNQQLYSWMITQISTIYFQSYQMALDMAKQAEKCFQYELGIENSSYIQSGSWDSLKKGLLAGEKLSTDLYRLEGAYHNQNSRELEITKHISLAQVAPLSLIGLKENGVCTLDLPEWLFDMDYPGHYMRRIKNVSITIPCVAGPYTSVNCTLSLIKSSIRKNSSLANGYRRNLEDDRFTDQLGLIRSIATSNAQEDNGMFELNFADERYLPFEGAGLISTWQIEMPLECNRIDFSTISDVVLHLQYTARDGGKLLKDIASNAVKEILPKSGLSIINMRQDFPNEWYHFTHQDQANPNQELKFSLGEKHFPFYTRNKKLGLTKLELIAHINGDNDSHWTLMLPDNNSEAVLMKKDGSYGLSHYGQKIVDGGLKPEIKGEWVLSITESEPLEIAEVFMIVHYNF